MEQCVGNGEDLLPGGEVPHGTLVASSAAANGGKAALSDENFWEGREASRYLPVPMRPASDEG